MGGDGAVGAELVAVVGADGSDNLEGPVALDLTEACEELAFALDEHDGGLADGLVGGDDVANFERVQVTECDGGAGEDGGDDEACVTERTFDAAA